MAKKQRRKKRRFVRVLAELVGAVFAAAAFCIFSLLCCKMLNQPGITLKAAQIHAEAGKTFDPKDAVESLVNAEYEDLVIEPASVDTSVPGVSSVGYSADTFFIPHKVFSSISLEFLSPGYAEETLEVEISDTEAPELTVVESPYQATTGVPVRVEDLVTSVSDFSEVTLTFKNGKDEYVTKQSKEKILTVVAVDAFGNETRKDVTVEFLLLDNKAPSIKGADDIVLQVGEAFDPLAGVTAKDDLMDDPVITVTPETVDTSVQGRTVLTYSVKDEGGNETVVNRTVAVYERVAGNGKDRFGCFWDLAGSADQPYLVTVNRVHNTVTVYGLDEQLNYTVPVTAFTCSIGPATPTGTYRTGERMRWHALMEECFGQYAIRITGHILFHSVPYFVDNDPSSLEYEEFNKLGEPASLGCIRLSVADEKWLYDNCPNGFTTVLYDDEISPGPLGKPDVIKIDLNDTARRGWDPTDPDPNNPWNPSPAEAPADAPADAGAAQ